MSTQKPVDENNEEVPEDEEESFPEWVKRKLNDMFVSSLPMDAIKVNCY